MDFGSNDTEGTITPTEPSTVDTAAVECWSRCLEIIRGRVNSQSYKTWFEPIQPLKFESDRFYIQVPSQFFSEWLDEHYVPIIREVFAQVTGREVEFHCLIRTEEREEISHLGEITEAGASLFDRPPTRPEPASFSPAFGPGRGTGVVQRPIVPMLNRRYTFENYITG